MKVWFDVSPCIFLHRLQRAGMCETRSERAFVMRRGCRFRTSSECSCYILCGRPGESSRHTLAIQTRLSSNVMLGTLYVWNNDCAKTEIKHHVVKSGRFSGPENPRYTIHWCIDSNLSSSLCQDTCTIRFPSCSVAALQSCMGVEEPLRRRIVTEKSNPCA